MKPPPNITDDINSLSSTEIEQLIHTFVGNDVRPKELLSTLSKSQITQLFFTILQNPEQVSHISEAMVKAGFAQRNLSVSGVTGVEGDRVVLSRWRKAANGAAIIATRMNAVGELEILFGKKTWVTPAKTFWSLPGGHYELDSHETLEHTLVAELMEETGIIPLSDEFMGYIEDTLKQSADVLPYSSLETAPTHFIARDVVWELIAVVSGDKAHHEKRCINVAYRVHFNDGDHLMPQGADDLGQLKWFKVSELEMSDGAGTEQFNENRVSLNRLMYGQDIMVEAMMRRLHAWTLCSQLVRTGRSDDVEFYVQYLQRLGGYAASIEKVYGLKSGAVLANYLVGSKHKEYIPRVLALHKIRMLLEKDLHALKAGAKTALALSIEREILTPFISTEDYL
jgi:ADP-ribose pyrophosphatase YjhB (NUDIX family)